MAANNQTIMKVEDLSTNDVLSSFVDGDDMA